MQSISYTIARPLVFFLSVFIGVAGFRISAAYALTPTDPLYKHIQPVYEQIGVPSAWNRTVGSRDVIVAVLDSGIDIDHADLSQNIWINTVERLNGLDDDGNGYIDDVNGWDFVSEDNGVGPDTGPQFSDSGIHHGTVVAGLIGAVGNNGVDALGVAMQVRIMPLKVMDNTGKGEVGNVIPAIQYATNMGADIINLSFSGPESSQALKNAMRAAYDAGVVVVVAAGNDNDAAESGDLDRFPKFPVCTDIDDQRDAVIGVGAVNQKDILAEFSNYGTCLDVVAPGTNIVSTLYHEENRTRFEDSFGGFFSGTSLAAPLVSGSAALLKSLHPDWTHQDIAAALYQTADPIDFLNPSYIGKLGFGRLNIEKASRVKFGEVVVTPVGENASRGGILIVAPVSGGLGEMRLIDTEDGFIRSFQPIGTTDTGVRFVADDLDNDGTAEIIVVNGETLQVIDQKGSLIRIIPQRTRATNPSLATADITGDGTKEIIVTYEKGSNTVWLYTHQGFDLGQFNGAHEPTSGLRVAAADITGDGVAEIITAASSNTASAHIWVHLGDGNLYAAFKTFESADNIPMSAGVDIAMGDINGDRIAEIIASPSAGSGVIRLFNWYGAFINEIYPFGDVFSGAISLATGDYERDGTDEIVVAAGKGGGPHVKMLNQFGTTKKEWFVYDTSFRGGTRVQFIHQ